MNLMGLVTLLTGMLASPFQLIILQADEGAEKTAAQKSGPGLAGFSRCSKVLGKLGSLGAFQETSYQGAMGKGR
jgi:hypothetical protein